MHKASGIPPVGADEEKSLLLVAGLSKFYQSASHLQPVLTNLDLTIGSGEIVALIGASGSGKTTLLNLISGIDTPDGGRVLIDGLDLHAQGEPQRTQQRRSQMGFVFQFFNLIPTLTVAENIALPLELNGASAVRQQGFVADLLQQIGLPHTADRYPDTLSGGEQQRVAIARALAHRPRLLLADEPTGNLDEDTGKDIMTMLVGLVREQGTALLLVTHSSRVAEQADRILHLSQGRLLQVK
jgi:putative ABC transport system ATP-binding protein